MGIKLLLALLITITVQADDYYLCDPIGNACKPGDTCCYRSNHNERHSWGCCPIENAVCCNDDEGHCCPIGYPICDVEHKTCKDHMGFEAPPFLRKEHKELDMVKGLGLKQYIKMFFVLNLQKNLLVMPCHLGKNIDMHLLEILKASVEGTCSPIYGHIICVLKQNELGEGKIQDGTGDVLFPISYKALVFMPYEGEVIDAIVHETNNEYGFGATIGPVQVFVEKSHMREYYHDSNARPHPRWVSSEDPMKVIEKDSGVRIRIIGKRYDHEEMFCIGSIDDEGLGPRLI